MVYIVLNLMFLIHFLVNFFVYSLRICLYALPYEYPAFPVLFVERLLFPHRVVLVPLLNLLYM